MKTKTVKKGIPYFLISPLLMILFVIVVLPMIMSTVQSFYNIEPIKVNEVSFVGFDNYVKMFRDKHIVNASITSIKYVVICIIGEIGLGLIFAEVLYSQIKFKNLILAIMMIPWSLPPILNAIMWKWIYDPSYGAMNDIFLKVGLIDKYQIWFANSNMAILLISIVHIWKMTPLITLIFLAQKKSISKELYQSAEVDGANYMQKFLKITLPLLKPAFLVVMIQSIVASIQLFDEIYALNGMSVDTRSLIMENYFVAFRSMKISYGMAIAVVVTLITLAISYISTNMKTKRMVKKI